MKDTSIRVSKFADNIFEAYIFYQKKQGKKLTKRALLENYANILMGKIPADFVK